MSCRGQKEEKEEFEQLEYRFEKLKDQVYANKERLDTIYNIFKGICYGIIIGALIFGVIQLRDFFGMLKPK